VLKSYLSSYKLFGKPVEHLNESARFGHEKNIIPRELRTEIILCWVGFQTREVERSVRMSARENKQEIRIASCFVSVN